MLRPLTGTLHAAQQPAALPIRAGEWRYSARAELREESEDLGLRTVTISLTDSGTAAAWLVTMSTELQGQMVTDSVVMRRADLSPVSRHAIIGAANVMLVVTDSVVHGLLTANTSVVPLNVRVGPKGFLNYYALRAALRELPLSEGWSGQASVLELGGEPVFATLALTIDGAEQVTVPAGVFDCWRLAVTGPGIDEHYWVSKQNREVVRTREPIGQGAIMQLDLVSFVPRP